jgi:cell division protein ZapA
MAMKKGSSDIIEVEIYGSTYNLRGGTDPGAVRALAADVDSRMRALAAAAPGADPLRVAILTALRLADEAANAREDAGESEGGLADRVQACSDRLARGLELTPASDGGNGAGDLDAASRVG